MFFGPKPRERVAIHVRLNVTVTAAQQRDTTSVEVVVAVFVLAIIHRDNLVRGHKTQAPITCGSEKHEVFLVSKKYRCVCLLCSCLCIPTGHRRSGGAYIAGDRRKK